MSSVLAIASSVAATTSTGLSLTLMRVTALGAAFGRLLPVARSRVA